ncbi:MAG: hypothetical protein QM783_14035 [Phycisphaerales bacterium]
MKKLATLAAVALVAALGACAQSETANASAENGMAKKGACCSGEAKATCTDKGAEAKAGGACCSSGEAKAGTCTEKAAQK